MANTICFLCGKKLTEETAIQSYFIPVEVCKKFKLCRANSVDNKIHICKRCQRQKGNKILFPPMHASRAISYVPEEYKEQLGRIQGLFNSLVQTVLDGNEYLVRYTHFHVNTVPNYTPYWGCWNHDYKRLGTKTETPSVFDKSKLYVSSDLSHLDDA